MKNTWDNYFFSYSFSKIKKSLLTNLKILGTFFLLLPFVKYLKKHTQESEKKLGQLFCTYLFFKYLKKHTYESENSRNSVFVRTLFQLFIKGYLGIWKYLGQLFCAYNFGNILKIIPRNRKIPGAIFFLIPFFKYLKNHTYESENTWNSVFVPTLFQLFIKGYLGVWKYLGQFFRSYNFWNI